MAQSSSMRRYWCCYCRDESPSAGNPRNKTALAPGHSLMDWIRLGSSGVDLTGVGGQMLTVTPAELARHNTEDDAWIAIRGVVFNVSRYMSFHPGGIPELMKGVGKDATKLFDDVHAWVNYQSILQKCVVGRLERSVSVDLIFESDKDKSKKNAKTVPDAAPESTSSSSLRMDWRQTTSSVSFFYSGACGECQVRKLSDSLQHSVRICLDDEMLAVTRCLSLAEEVEWPPNCKRHAETSEIEITFRKKQRGIWKTYGTSVESSEKLESTVGRSYNEYELLENTALCKVVHFLVLRARNYVQLVPPGRHVDARMNVMGTEVSRLYTPVPSCLHPDERPALSCCDNDNESSCLYLMVKRYEDGALTPSLCQMTVGQTIILSNTLGEFKIETYDRFSVVNMLAAGSGLTVMLPIIKRALSRRNPPEIKLINFNRNEDQIFYAKQLQRVAGERTLSLTHVLSESNSSFEARHGKVSAELLKELMGERSSRGCVFTCGPPAFMTAARDCLRELGWVPSQIHEFDG